MPENTQPALVFTKLASLHDRSVDAKILVVLGGDLDQPAAHLLKHDEVFDDVEKPRVFADPTDRGFQRHHPLLAFLVNALPLEKVLPRGEGATDARFATVGQHYQPVGRKQLGDGAAVVGQVVVVGVL